jgi:hypothetical protein
MGSTNMLSDYDVLSLVHNIFLPPKLPQSEDNGAVAREAVLLTCVSDALGCFGSGDDTLWSKMPSTQRSAQSVASTA